MNIQTRIPGHRIFMSQIISELAEGEITLKEICEDMELPLDSAVNALNNLALALQEGPAESKPKFHNPKLQEAFDDIDPFLNDTMKNISIVSSDIKNIEEYLQSKPVPDFICQDTQMLYRYIGNKKRICKKWVIENEAYSIKPLIELPVHERIAAALDLPTFLKNLQTFMERKYQ